MQIFSDVFVWLEEFSKQERKCNYIWIIWAAYIETHETYFVIFNKLIFFIINLKQCNKSYTMKLRNERKSFIEIDASLLFLFANDKHLFCCLWWFLYMTYNRVKLCGRMNRQKNWIVKTKRNKMCTDSVLFFSNAIGLCHCIVFSHHCHKW